MASGPDEKMLDLEEKIAALQSVKSRLIKELDEIEEKYEKTDRLYKKYFPLIIDALAIDETSFGKVCRNLSDALKKGDSSGKIEYIFEQIKNVMIKEDLVLASPTKKKGLFASLKKDPASVFIEAFKKGYHEAVNTLKSSLGDEYIKKLNRITEAIHTVQDINDMNGVREIIFQLIQEYISNTNEDREKVAAFVQEVVVKIFEIESILTRSFEQSNQMEASNHGFESILTTELKGIKDKTIASGSLEELKIQISQRLSSIEKALQKKQATDKALKELGLKNRQNFQSGFVKLKKELDKATRHSEELEKKLNRDQLTGAYNRRAYDKTIEDEMERFLRYQSIFSLLLIDADKFKDINDKYGHAIGDRCLQEIIKRTLPLLRKNDMLARYGGEEFVVIMPGTDNNGAKEAAEKIRHTIEKIGFVYKDEKVKVTVSIGVAQCEAGDTSHQAIFERADIAVYQAKENGRNQVVVHHKQ